MEDNNNIVIISNIVTKGPVCVPYGVQRYEFSTNTATVVIP